MNEHLSFLALERIMDAYSDEKHYLSIKEIKDYLLNDYGIKKNEKWIKASLNELDQNGFTLGSSYEGGYFLLERSFDKEEKEELIESVLLNKNIDEEETLHLIDKILNTQSVYAQDDYSVFSKDTGKSESLEKRSELFRKFLALIDAIENDKEIRITYEGKHMNFFPLYLEVKRGDFAAVGIDDKNNQYELKIRSIDLPLKD